MVTSNWALSLTCAKNPFFFVFLRIPDLRLEAINVNLIIIRGGILVHVCVAV